MVTHIRNQIFNLGVVSKVGGWIGRGVMCLRKLGRVRFIGLVFLTCGATVASGCTVRG